MVNRWLEPRFKQDTIHFFKRISQCGDKEYTLSLLKFYTAPCRLGSKTANLVNLRCNDRNLKLCWEENKEEIKEELSLQAIELKSTETSVLLYLYAEDKLDRRVRQRKVRDFLSGCGYEACVTRQDYLETLKTRFSKEKTCPNEVGIFLGYPLDDVIAFHRNNPNHKCVGYWKCYSNVFLSKIKFFIYDLSKWSVTWRNAHESL